MGRAARWVVGGFSALFAGMMFYSEFSAPSNAPVVGYLVALFCVLITIACFSSALRNPALRVIGVMVFAMGVAYLVYELRYEPRKPYEGRSEPHWLNAVFFLVFFGLPGLSIATSGLFGRKSVADVGEKDEADISGEEGESGAPRREY